VVKVISANQITLDDVETRFGLTFVREPTFFPECLNLDAPLPESSRHILDRVQSNFLTLLKRSVVLENIVKMVLSPLLDLAGFYELPYQIEAETSVELELENQDELIRGRIDVLVLNQQLWLLVIESKRASFDVLTAVSQALTYMLGNPDATQPSYGLITNGNLFLFLKLIRQPQPQYTYSRLFSIVNPGNELYFVLQILQRLGSAIQ
jgi:hypothetical protein